LFRPDLESLLPRHDIAAHARMEKVMTMPAIPAGLVDFQASDREAIRALYVGGFRAFDAWFAGFWEFLERSGLRENTLVVLTADHGEELLERGHVGHASTTRAGHLHEEIVRVPLVIWWPKSHSKHVVPARVTTPSDHLDVMPTIFALLELEPTRRFGGSNLLALPAARPWRAVTSAAGFAEANPFDIPKYIFAAIDGPWKLHMVRERGSDTRIALFNIESDPEERYNLAEKEADVAARIRDSLMPLILSMRLPSPPQPTAEGGVAQPPRWVSPPGSGTFRYDDLAGRLRLQWSGHENQTYRIQYEAGTGAVHIAGEFNVTGTVRDFGTIDRDYWNKWVVAYGSFRLRVGVAGHDDRWSEWIELSAVP
jgi:hypothetical protein